MKLPVNNGGRLTKGWASSNARQIRDDVKSRFGDCRALTPEVKQALADSQILRVLLAQCDEVYNPAKELVRALIAESEQML